jgi:hypothetical protein
MLFLLSPAKSLDYETPTPPALRATQPQFLQQSHRLIEVLREQSPQQIATLMSLSDPLATLTVARYQAWSPRFTEENSRQAVLAFDGDVYAGLEAGSLSVDDLEWAQSHVAILSGLYGVLRPLDRLQPYRLEMGTRLATEAGRDLYHFWGRQIADHLNRAEGAGGRMRVPGVEGRRLQDRQLPCQAGPRADGPPCHPAPAPDTRTAARLRPRRLPLRRRRLQPGPHGLPPQDGLIPISGRRPLFSEP